jgi:hypothetical protein
MVTINNSWIFPFFCFRVYFPFFVVAIRVFAFSPCCSLGTPWQGTGTMGPLTPLGATNHRYLTPVASYDVLLYLYIE